MGKKASRLSIVSYLLKVLGTRWASWNLGVFLCIQCGGIHRKLGTHISKVKSVTLDAWTDDQAEYMKKCGNSMMNSIYNPKGKVRPNSRDGMEQFIRDKYERKLWADPILLKSIPEPPLGPRQENYTISDSGSSQSSRYEHASNLNESISSSSTLSKKQLQSHVARSSSTNGSLQPSDSINELMVKLYDMGFEEPAKNREALKTSNGNLSQAIDYLVSIKRSSPSIPYESQLKRLQEMGFKNRELNVTALGHSNGKLEEAINFIVANADLDSNNKQQTLTTSLVSLEDPISNTLPFVSMTMEPLKPQSTTNSNSTSPIIPDIMSMYNTDKNIATKKEILNCEPIPVSNDPFAELLMEAKLTRDMAQSTKAEIANINSKQKIAQKSPTQSNDLAIFDNLFLQRPQSSLEPK